MNRYETRPKTKIGKYIAWIAIGTILVGAVFAFRELFPVKSTRPEFADVKAYLVRTKAASKILVATQDAWFESDYVVPASFLGIRSDYRIRFRVLVALSFAFDVDDDDWGVDVAGVTVRVRTPELAMLEPRILTETFEILREDRSILVDEEATKLKLFKELGPWVLERAAEAADWDAAKDVAAETVRSIASKAFQMFDKVAEVIDVWVP
jgi:hypothetical protein